MWVTRHGEAKPTDVPCHGAGASMRSISTWTTSSQVLRSPPPTRNLSNVGRLVSAFRARLPPRAAEGRR